MQREVWYIEDSGQIIVGVHKRTLSCQTGCVVHCPSDHHMREMPLQYDEASKAFVRTCEHGNQHQDYDEREDLTALLSEPDRYEEVLLTLSRWKCPICDCGCCNPESSI